MDFDADENLDAALRGLGQGTPFSVDWRDYDARLAQRLLERERGVSRTMRRTGIVYAACGAFAGAALTAAALYLFVLAPLHVTGTPALSIAAPAPVGPEIADGTPTHVLNGSGTATFYKDPAQTETAPFESDFIRTDGSLGQIRFEGFSAATETGWIAARPNER